MSDLWSIPAHRSRVTYLDKILSCLSAKHDLYTLTTTANVED